MIGKVLFFNNERNYGMMRIDKKKVFLHVRELRQSGFEGNPKEGEFLDVDVQDSERGPRAFNVRRV